MIAVFVAALVVMAFVPILVTGLPRLMYEGCPPERERMPRPAAPSSTPLPAPLLERPSAELIPVTQARAAVLQRNLLWDSPSGTVDGPRVARTIAALGYVQVDSIRTVERAHHTILYTRHHRYRPRRLQRLIEVERAMFEAWTHDAAILPIAFYPQWRRRFAADASALRTRWAHRLGEDPDRTISAALAHVEKHGPTSARELTKGGGTPGGWWDWQPEKTALEYLWRAGTLAVSRRSGFEKIYDLAERVIPQAVRGVTLEDHAIVEWACVEALRRLAFATPKQIAAFFGLISLAEAQDFCVRNEAVRLRRVRLAGPDGAAGPEMFALADELFDDPVEPAPRLRVVSPFDPLIRDRPRTELLFGFDYRIEVFVPKAERRYGYYVFPLLEGSRFVGRADIVRDPAADALFVRRLWPERGVRFGRGRTERLKREMERLARFAGTRGVRFAHDWLAEPR